MGSVLTRRAIIIKLLSCFCFVHLSAQQLKFRSFHVEDGLSNNSVNKLINDPSGTLWIATWDGLNSFDGKDFEVFRHMPGDSSSLPSNFIYGLTRDISQRIWVRTDPRTISYMSGQGKFKNFYFQEKIGKYGLSESGEMMISFSGGRKVFSQGGFRDCSSCRFQIDEKEQLGQLLEKNYPKVRVLDVYTDSRGVTWFATLKDGLFVLSVQEGDMSKPTFRQYEHDPFDPYSLSSNEIYDIHEDVFGNIWLGMKDGGIVMVLKDSDKIHSVYPHPKQNPALPDETIRAITQDQKDRIWLGFYNSGLFHSVTGGPVFEPFPLSPPGNHEDWKRIRSLYTDHKGDVWVGTYAGVIRITREGKVKYFSPEEHPYLCHPRNYDFFEDKERGLLWVACWGGLAKFSYEKENFIPYEGQDLLAHYHIRQVLVDGPKVYLATEQHGVIVFSQDRATVSSIGTDEGISDESVYDIWKDGVSGNLWIATLGGISIYHPKKGLIKNLDQQDGLRSQFVYGLLSSEEQVWASTTSGITVIDKDDHTIDVLPWNQGWQGAEFSEGAFYQNTIGTLFFGGVNGLNYFHPNRINFSQELPLVYLIKDPQWKEQLVSGRFSVQVRSVSFSPDPDNHIVYRLEPLQETWQELGEGGISFEHLPVGDYTLLLGNSKSLKGEHLQRLAFTIPKPLWKSPVFLSLSGLLLVALLLFWRYKSMRSLQHRLEVKIEERTKTIASQKSWLEVKNQEISAQKEELLGLYQRYKDDEFESNKFQQFFLDQFRVPIIEFKEGFDRLKVREQDSKRELDHLLDRLLNELRQWESAKGKDLLDDTLDSAQSLTLLPQLIEDLLHQTKELLDKYGVSLQEEVCLPQDWIQLDVLKFKMCWQYLFREVAKYLSEGSCLALDVRESPGVLKVCLSIPGNLFHSAFEDIWRFSPYISSCKALVKDMEGDISHESAEERVWLKLNLPFQVLASEPEKQHFRHWKHLELAGALRTDRPNVLLLTKQYEFGRVTDMMNTDKFEILLEEDITMIKQGIGHLPVDALIIHNRKIDKRIAELIKKIKDNPDKKKRIPIVYLHDMLNHALHEKLLDMGVDTVIKLPMNPSLLIKQMIALMEANRASLREDTVPALLMGEEPQGQLSPSEKLVREGLEVIKNNLESPDFKVSKLSELLQISQIKCYRIFKEVLDTSPSDLIVRLRLEKAKNLIQKKSLNVSEVSYSCGFNDPKYFSKVFKKHFGTSPKNYVEG